MPNAAIPVRIINLKRSPERRVYMEKQLKGRGIKYEFFNATDGRKLTEKDLALFDPIRLKKWPGVLHVDMSHNLIASALTKLRLYEWMVEANIPRMLVMEDDIFLSDDFFTALNTFEAWAPKDWGVINFYTTCSPFLPIPNQRLRVGLALYALPTLPKYNLVRCVRRSKMAACFMITLKAAKRMLKIGYPIRMSSDVLLGTLDLNHFNLYTLFPDLIKTFDLPSTIDEPGDQAPTLRTPVSPKRALLGKSGGQVPTPKTPIPTKRTLLYVVWREIWYHLYQSWVCCHVAIRHKGARRHFLRNMLRMILYSARESYLNMTCSLIARIGLPRFRQLKKRLGFG